MTRKKVSSFQRWMTRQFNDLLYMLLIGQLTLILSSCWPKLTCFSSQIIPRKKKEKPKQTCVIELEETGTCSKKAQIMQKVRIHLNCYIKFYIRECFYVPFCFMILVSTSSLICNKIDSLTIGFSTTFSISIIHYSFQKNQSNWGKF